MKKKIIALVIFIFLCISLSTISVNAHSESLNIEYDDCLPDYFVDDNDFGDGYYEKWYQLYDRSNKSIHMSHSSTTTIKYYFKDLSRNGQVSWNDYLSEEEEIEFKNAFADSIKKWNNIYVYRLNNGYYEKIKLVNIVEGNENNSNLFIWPGNSGDLAITTSSPTSSPDDEMLETKNDIIHLHINIWDTIINLDDYKNNLINNLENKTKVFERLGAHELGHLLGLSDIDYTENHINGELYHHEEVLMGYSNTKTDISINSNRQTEITY